jgi:hypothetical protein
MSGIKYKHLTREIEINGSESFIAANFSRIEDLLDKRDGRKESMTSIKAQWNRECISSLPGRESDPQAEISTQERSEASPLSRVNNPLLPEISHESKAKRPPLRKYIRREGIPGQQRIVVEVCEQKPREISLASLREKFGLTGSKIGGIVRDDEPGEIRKLSNGS